MKVYLSAGEEVYPVRTVSDVLDAEHEFEGEMMPSMFEFCVRAEQNYRLAQKMLNDLKTEPVPRRYYEKSPSHGQSCAGCGQ